MTALHSWHRCDRTPLCEGPEAPVGQAPRSLFQPASDRGSRLPAYAVLAPWGGIVLPPNATVVGRARPRRPQFAEIWHLSVCRENAQKALQITMLDCTLIDRDHDLVRGTVTAMPRISEIPPAVQAARIRAAIGYSGKDAKTVAAELGISPQSLARRYGAAGAPKGASSIDELHAIASICGVPPAFMEEGFERSNGVQGALDGRIRALEQAQQRQPEALDAMARAAQDDRAELRADLDRLRGELDSLKTP